MLGGAISSYWSFLSVVIVTILSVCFNSCLAALFLGFARSVLLIEVRGILASSFSSSSITDLIIPFTGCYRGLYERFLAAI